MAYKLKSDQSAAAKRHYDQNAEAIKARAKVHTEAQRQVLREYVAKAKAQPCADCQTGFPSCVMDFDHVRGKKRANVSSMANAAVALGTLQAEIEKCDVVCANCHRIRTHLAGDSAGAQRVAS